MGISTSPSALAEKSDDSSKVVEQVTKRARDSHNDEAGLPGAGRLTLDASFTLLLICWVIEECKLSSQIEQATCVCQVQSPLLRPDMGTKLLLLRLRVKEKAFPIRTRRSGALQTSLLWKERRQQGRRHIHQKKTEACC